MSNNINPSTYLSGGPATTEFETGLMKLPEVEALKAKVKAANIEKETGNLYRRAWQIIVVPRDKFEGDDDEGTAYHEDDAIVLTDSVFGDASLHCKFRVESSYKVPLYGEVLLYNPSQNLVDTIVTQGARLIIKAGYLNGAYGTIWNANIYNFIEYRENVVDRILVLYSISPYLIFQKNYIVAHVTKQENNPVGQFERLTKQFQIPHVTRPKPLEEADPNPSSRGAVLNGSLYDLCKAATKSAEGCTLSIKDADGKTVITATKPFGKIDVNEELVITPDTGLIGTPASIPFGVTFKTLLDPRLKWSDPVIQVALENTEVKVQQTQVGIGAPLPMYSNHGRYRVASVTHYGDTRGQDWYTDCTAVVDPNMLATAGISQVEA